MRKAAEAVYGAINDKIAPGHAYVELVFEQIEESHMEAVPLTRVLCVEDGDLMATGAIVDGGGVVRIRRSRQEVAAPTDPEALRRRLRTWGFAYTYARLKHPGRAWLADALPEAIADYFDWLLGDQVRGLESKDEHGTTIGRPPWALVLRYEFEVRKLHAKKVNEGASFRTALREAMADTALRDRRFITPLVIGSGSSATRPRRPERSRSPGGKGSKGKRAFGKGRGRSAKARGRGSEEWRASTPDGRQICFAFNNAKERCSGKCGRVHVCRRCLGKHPAHTCRQQLEGDPVQPAGGALHGSPE
jgi:hypothetical protein